MDVIRSCYTSTWNLPSVGEVDGYYYFSPPGTPFYPHWNYFGSRNWHKGDGSQWPIYGEIETAKQRWQNGKFGVNFPDTIVLGTQDEIEGITPSRGHCAPFNTLGVPISCWLKARPIVTDDAGGELQGGRADASQGWGSTDHGGEQVGGNAAEVIGLVSEDLGGEQVGGNAAEVIGLVSEDEGGAQIAGNAAEVIGLVSEDEGGEQDGGTADDAKGSVSNDSGGMASGNSATDAQGWTTTDGGGLKTGQSATP